MWEVWNQRFCWTLLSCPLTECHNNGVLLTWLLLVLHLLLGPEEGMHLLIVLYTSHHFTVSVVMALINMYVRTYLGHFKLVPVTFTVSDVC